MQATKYRPVSHSKHLMEYKNSAYLSPHTFVWQDFVKTDPLLSSKFMGIVKEVNPSALRTKYDTKTALTLYEKFLTSK